MTRSSLSPETCLPSCATITDNWSLTCVRRVPFAYGKPNRKSDRPGRAADLVFIRGEPHRRVSPFDLVADRRGRSEG
jgi:hypothetical protein